MYQLIACDLDETLLQADRSISQKNIDAIQAAQKLGVKFVPATGRNYISVQPTLEQLGLKNLAGEYVISFNGGAITENKGNRVLQTQGLTFEMGNELFKRGLQYDVCIHVYTRDKVYVYRLDESEKSYQAGRMELDEFDAESLDFIKDQEIIKVLYMNTDRQYLQKIESDLSDVTGDLDVSYSSNRYIEFNKKGVNKGGGLQTLANLLGIDMKNVIAIGDNFNDLSMIQAAGLGIGVQNTVEAMKAECDVITQATCDQSAIAEVIERFIFSERA